MANQRRPDDVVEVIVGSSRVALGSLLGEGGFAFVYSCSDIYNPSVRYVLKKIIIQDLANKALVQKEIKLLQRLNHPNIVKYYDSQVAPTGRQMEALILMEYCSGGSLYEVIRRRGKHPFDKVDILRIAKDVTGAVACLHHQNPPIAHCDLKLENVLLTNQGIYKLIDFGSAVEGPVPLTNVKERSGEEERIAKYTTQMYRAPEMVDLYMRRSLDEKIDIWALGCVFFTVVHSLHPYQDAGNLGILNGRARKVHVLPEVAEIHELIERMLCIDAGARLTIDEVQEHLESIKAGRPLPPKTRTIEQEDLERRRAAVRSISPRGGRSNSSTASSALAPSSSNQEARRLDPNSAAARRLASRGGANTTTSNFSSTGGGGSNTTGNLISMTVASSTTTTASTTKADSLFFDDAPPTQQFQAMDPFSSNGHAGGGSSQARRPSMEDNSLTNGTSTTTKRQAASVPSSIAGRSTGRQASLSDDFFADEFGSTTPPLPSTLCQASGGGDLITITGEGGGGFGNDVLIDGGEGWANFDRTGNTPRGAAVSSFDVFAASPSTSHIRTPSSSTTPPTTFDPFPSPSNPLSTRSAFTTNDGFPSTTSLPPQLSPQSNNFTSDFLGLSSSPTAASSSSEPPTTTRTTSAPPPKPPKPPVFLPPTASPQHDPFAVLTTHPPPPPPPTSYPPRPTHAPPIPQPHGRRLSGSGGIGGFAGGGLPTSSATNPFAALTPSFSSSSMSSMGSNGMRPSSAGAAPQQHQLYYQHQQQQQQQQAMYQAGGLGNNCPWNSQGSASSSSSQMVGGSGFYTPPVNYYYNSAGGSGAPLASTRFSPMMDQMQVQQQHRPMSYPQRGPSPYHHQQQQLQQQAQFYASSGGLSTGGDKSPYSTGSGYYSADAYGSGSSSYSGGLGVSIGQQQQQQQGVGAGWNVTTYSPHSSVGRGGSSDSGGGMGGGALGPFEL